MDDQFSAGNTNHWGDFKVSAIPSASSLTLPNPNIFHRRTSLDRVTCGVTTLAECFSSQDYVHVHAQHVLEQRNRPPFVMSSPGGFQISRQATNSLTSSWSSSELVPTLPPTACVERNVRPLSSAPAFGLPTTSGWVLQATDKCCSKPPAPSPSTCSVEQPRAIPVACGSASGIFLVEQASVLLQEDGCLTRKISPTEMERLGGKGAAKKWKTTLRVLDSKGNVGKPVGDWLKKRGIELRTLQRPSQTKAKKKRRTSRVVLKPVNACPTPTKEFKKQKDKQQSMVKIAMDAHLERCHVGYRQGDPECAELPGKLRPAESCPGVREVDLKQMSYEQLLILARSDGSSGGCVSGTLLTSPPGVLAGREAYISGQGPRQRHVASECAESMALIGEYLNGRLSTPPWEAFSAEKPPVVGGQEVDLRELYSKVRMSGGFDQVTMSRRWANISEEMGLSGGLALSIGYGLRSVYQRFLLRFEHQEEALNQFSGEQAPSTGETNPTTEGSSKNESNNTTNTATSQSIAKEELTQMETDHNPPTLPQSDTCQN